MEAYTIPTCLRPLVPIIEQIRKYTKSNSELANAHHYLFALPIDVPPDAKRADYVVMGINTGNSKETENLTPGVGHEESFMVDFQMSAKKIAAGRKRWITNARKILGECPIVMTEAFFWASYNLTDFEARFGKFNDSVHLDFCSRCNLELFELLSPNAIVVPGLVSASSLRDVYGLSLADTVRCPDTNHKLVEEYHDGLRPWFFTKHWSGSRGFTRKQRAIISETITRND